MLIFEDTQGLPAWAPTADDVRRRLPRRLEFEDGGELVVIDAHVADVIADIKANIRANIRTEVPEDLHDYARGTAAVGVAGRLEAAMFPEQNDDNGSPADRLASEYAGRLLRLRSLVDNSTGPQFSFPPALAWPA